MIKVSFILIGYNIEQYVEKAILSVVNQTISDIELIMVDDGSTDGTLEIMRKFEEEYVSCKVIQQSNKGANAARKEGFKCAVGKYVVFIDGDDWVEEKLAEEVYEVAEEGKYDIVMYNHNIVNEKKCCIKRNNLDKEDENKYLELMLQQKISHCIWDRMYSRDFLDKNSFINIPNITMGDDLTINIRMAIEKPKVKFISKPYYYYYQREDSVTKKMSKKTIEIEKALLDVENSLKKSNLYSRYKREIEFLWYKHSYISPIINKRYVDRKISQTLFRIWKSKNINSNKNELCLEINSRMTGMIKVKKKCFDINYYLGYIVSKILLYLYKIRKIQVCRVR